MVDVFENLEREEFVMNGNLFFFFFPPLFMEHGEKLFVAEIHFFEMAFCLPKKFLQFQKCAYLSHIPFNFSNKKEHWTETTLSALSNTKYKYLKKHLILKT